MPGVDTSDVSVGPAGHESSSAGGMTLSVVPTTAHDGMAAQAGGPDVSVAALAASGRWVAARTPASRALRPLAKQPGNLPACRYRSASSSGAPGNSTGLNTVFGSPPMHEPAPSGRISSSPIDSPLAGMNASTYTSALTSGSPTAASVMTAPP